VFVLFCRVAAVLSELFSDVEFLGVTSLVNSGFGGERLSLLSGVRS
jgi:hypothetical protein